MLWRHSLLNFCLQCYFFFLKENDKHTSTYYLIKSDFIIKYAAFLTLHSSTITNCILWLERPAWDVLQTHADRYSQLCQSTRKMKKWKKWWTRKNTIKQEGRRAYKSKLWNLYINKVQCSTLTLVNAFLLIQTSRLLVSSNFNWFQLFVSIMSISGQLLVSLTPSSQWLMDLWP